MHKAQHQGSRPSHPICTPSYGTHTAGSTEQGSPGNAALPGVPAGLRGHRVLAWGGALLHVTLLSAQGHMLIDPHPLPACSTITYLSPRLVGTQGPRSSRMRLLAGPSLLLTVAHTGSPPQSRYAAHRGKRALVLPLILGALPLTALVCLLVVLDPSRPKAYSPGRFSGRQLWYCGSLQVVRGKRGLW